MKRLDRYVLRELIVPFIIGTFAVVLMFDANLLIALQKQLDLSSVPRAALAQFILYKTPFFMNMTLPVGMALAASLAMSRLARESELTAMRSAGARILRVIAPIAGFGVLVSIGNFYLVEKVMPVSERKADSLQRQIGILVALPDLAENAFIRLDKYQVSIGQVTKTGEGRLQLKDVLVLSRPGPGIQQIVSAKSGTYDHGQWSIGDAYIWQIDKGDLTQFKPHQQFPINERVSIDDLFMPPAPEQLTAAQLRTAIFEAHRQKRPAQELEVQYYVRFAVPAACIIFAFVAPAFAIMFARSGGFAGVLLSIFLVFLYYNAFVISTDILGKNGSVPPFLAAWTPNILFAILGFFAVRRLE